MAAIPRRGAGAATSPAGVFGGEEDCEAGSAGRLSAPAEHDVPRRIAMMPVKSHRNEGLWRRPEGVLDCDHD